MSDNDEKGPFGAPEPAPRGRPPEEPTIVARSSWASPGGPAASSPPPQPPPTPPEPPVEAPSVGTSWIPGASAAGGAQDATHQSWAQPGHVAGSDDGGSFLPPPSAASGEGRPRRTGTLAIALVAALIGGAVGGAVVGASDDQSGSKGSSGSYTTVPPGQASTASATPTAVRAVLSKVESALVQIHTDSGDGTGMVLTADGQVLTNNHVIRNERTNAVASSISVTPAGKTEASSAHVLGTDPTNDIAVIKMDGVSNLPTVALGDSDAVQVGDEIVAIGNALALSGDLSVTTGIVSAKNRTISDSSGVYVNLLQTDAAINPGNSGGPLVDMSGAVIGMSTAVIRGSEGEYEGMGFAIPSNAIKAEVGDLVAGKVPSTAYLGVSTETVTSEVKNQYDLSVDKGVLVDTVQSGSPADDAGIKRYDVITQVDDRTISTAEDLVAVVRNHRVGDKVTITYVPGGSGAKKTAVVALGARPSGS